MQTIAIAIFCTGILAFCAGIIISSATNKKIAYIRAESAIDINTIKTTVDIDALKAIDQVLDILSTTLLICASMLVFGTVCIIIGLIMLPDLIQAFGSFVIIWTASDVVYTHLIQRKQKQ